MIDFENRIIDMMRTESSGPDSASFIAKLHGRQEKEMMRKKRMQSGFSAFAFIFLVGMLTTSQFVELPKQDIYWSEVDNNICLLYTSPSPRDATLSRMPSSA